MYTCIYNIVWCNKQMIWKKKTIPQNFIVFNKIYIEYS